MKLELVNRPRGSSSICRSLTLFVCLLSVACDSVAGGEGGG